MLRDAQKNILAHVFVDMLMASSCDNICEAKRRDVTEQLENRERRKSRFVTAMFNEEETKVRQNTTQKAKEAAEKPQNEDTRHHLVSELQTLDRDRKRSFVVRVIDGLLSRLDHNQSETSSDNIEDDVAASGDRDKNEAVPIIWKQETELENLQREDTEKVYKAHAKFGIDKEGRIDGSTGEVVLTKYRHRGRIQNLASEYGIGEKAENCSPCDPSGVRKQIKSVAFSLPVTSPATGTDKKGEKEMPDEKKLIMTGAERRHIHLQQQRTDSEESGFPSPLPLDGSAKRRPKTVKDWLMDSNVYKVALIFTCSRLVQDAVYTYLPLFLTERLQFAKEAIAYFPLVLLISATFASTLCEKLNKKIGSKWSYLLAASLVMGGAVWSYFQTPSIRQSTYAPVILIGLGMSVMYVMALAFITELIWENKETSGSVISIITVIARLSSGGLLIGIQAFYPKKDTDSNEAISDYVQHVFVMAPGMLTLVGFLLVLFLQSSTFVCKIAAPKNDTEAQTDEQKSPFDDIVPQFSSDYTATASISLDVQQYPCMSSCPDHEDTKI